MHSPALILLLPVVLTKQENDTVEIGMDNKYSPAVQLLVLKKKKTQPNKPTKQKELTAGVT